MANIKMLNMAGEEAGSIELSDAIFGIEPNEYAVHAVVKNYLANRRQGTQSAKTRGDVRGGGRKPFRQKGTGRHRQGSSTDPSQIGGGVVFAPKPRSYRYTLPTKVRRLAMLSVLSSKFAENVVRSAANLKGIRTAVVGSFNVYEVINHGSLILTEDAVKKLEEVYK